MELLFRGLGVLSVLSLILGITWNFHIFFWVLLVAVAFSALGFFLYLSQHLLSFGLQLVWVVGMWTNNGTIWVVETKSGFWLFMVWGWGIQLKFGRWELRVWNLYPKGKDRCWGMLQAGLTRWIYHVVSFQWWRILQITVYRKYWITFGLPVVVYCWCFWKLVFVSWVRRYVNLLICS